jgi:hypothetical protein
MLDKLLDGGYISPADYVKRLPIGSLIDRDSLLEEISKKESAVGDTFAESEAKI